MLLDDAGIFVDQESGGQSWNATIFRNEFAAPHYDGIVHVKGFCEFFNVIRGAIVDRHADDEQVVLIFLGEFSEDRNFFAAWRTPRGPEIQNYDFALPLRSGNDIAIEILHKKRGDRLRVTRETNHPVTIVVKQSGHIRLDLRIRHWLNI